jgi:hypothetical protein
MHTHTHIYAHTHTHTRIHTYKHTHKHTHTQTHTYTHIYTHTYTHSHTYTRTYIYTYRLVELQDIDAVAMHQRLFDATGAHKNTFKPFEDVVGGFIPSLKTGKYTPRKDGKIYTGTTTAEEMIYTIERAWAEWVARGGAQLKREEWMRLGYNKHACFPDDMSIESEIAATESMQNHIADMAFITELMVHARTQSAHNTNTNPRTTRYPSYSDIQ